MARISVAVSGLALLTLVGLALGVSFAFAAGSSAPPPNTVYKTNPTSSVGTTSVEIDIGASGRRVHVYATCYQKHGVQVQAELGMYSYALHVGAFSVSKTYEVDKLIPDPENSNTCRKPAAGRW